MRIVRDREYARASLCAATAKHEPTQRAYYIEAKLHPSHAGVGSWALLHDVGESQVRRQYDRLFPGRVIVKLTPLGERTNTAPRKVRDR